jgi:hypothetical protein
MLGRKRSEDNGIGRMIHAVLQPKRQYCCASFEYRSRRYTRWSTDYINAVSANRHTMQENRPETSGGSSLSQLAEDTDFRSSTPAGNFADIINCRHPSIDRTGQTLTSLLGKTRFRNRAALSYIREPAIEISPWS